MTLKDLRYIKTNSVNPLYIIINKINGNIEESNENKCLRVVPTDESKDTLKKYEELCTKIRVLIRSKTYMVLMKKNLKIKSNSDDHVPLNKMLDFHSMIIVIRLLFHEGLKYYRQAFLD